ncbi:hypothetical protein AMECASPLE_020147 [Ameca splendens]|uniref:Uncharacterized protein n=1 Tax=Ameca splendens TaxID=208324 RepID=A0ABV0ZNV2_9TELE
MLAGALPCPYRRTLPPRDELHHCGVICKLNCGIVVVSGGAVVGVEDVEQGVNTQPCGEPVLRLSPEDVCRPIQTSPELNHPQFQRFKLATVHPSVHFCFSKMGSRGTQGAS